MNGNLIMKYIIASLFIFSLEIYILNNNIFFEKTKILKEAQNFYALGEKYRVQNKNNLSLKYYQEALEFYREIDDKKQIANCFNYIGNIYFSQNKKDLALVFFEDGKYNIALNYYKKALKIRENINNKINLSQSFNNIANVY